MKRHKQSMRQVRNSIDDKVLLLVLLLFFILLALIGN